jgi:hypothetical protein
MLTDLNLLMRLCFGACPHEYVNYFAPQHKTGALTTKDFTGELFIPD